MQKPVDIIKEIKAEAAGIQKKLMTIPNTEPGGYSKQQSDALVDAQDGLSFWRRTHLELLAKAFGEGT
jgi:hypothetical protein